MNYQRSRVALLAAFAAMGTIVVGCSDSPVAPQPQAEVSAAPAPGLVGDLLGLAGNLAKVKVNGLLRILPQQSVSRSITVDANGGVLEVPQTGLRITIPRGAVTTRTTITVTAQPGMMIAYDFQPHGIKFNVPLQFSQDLRGSKLKDGDVLMGGYFSATSQLSAWLGIAEVDEEIPARVVDGRVQFPVWHFSGYLVSTGRTKTTTTVRY